MSSYQTVPMLPQLRRQQSSHQLHPTGKRGADLQVTSSSVATSSIGQNGSARGQRESKVIRKVISIKSMSNLGSKNSSRDLSARYKADVLSGSAAPAVPALNRYQAFNLPRQHCRLQPRAPYNDLQPDQVPPVANRTPWQRQIAPTLERCIKTVAERDHICNIASLERARMTISEPFVLPKIRYACLYSRFKHPYDPQPSQIPIPDLSLHSSSWKAKLQLAKMADVNVEEVDGMLLKYWAPGTIAYTKMGSQWCMKGTHQFPDIASANHDLAMRSNGKKAIVTIFCPSAAIKSSAAYLVFASPGLIIKKGIDEAVERLLKIKPSLQGQFEDRHWTEDPTNAGEIDPKMDASATPTFGFDLLSPEVRELLEVEDEQSPSASQYHASSEDMRQMSAWAASMFKRNAAPMSGATLDRAWRVLPEGLPYLTAEDEYQEAEDQQQDMMAICAMTASIGVTFTYAVDVHDKVQTTVHISHQFHTGHRALLTKMAGDVWRSIRGTLQVSHVVRKLVSRVAALPPPSTAETPQQLHYRPPQQLLVNYQMQDCRLASKGISTTAEVEWMCGIDREAGLHHIIIDERQQREVETGHWKQRVKNLLFTQSTAEAVHVDDGSDDEFIGRGPTPLGTPVTRRNKWVEDQQHALSAPLPSRIPDKSPQPVARTVSMADTSPPRLPAIQFERAPALTRSKAPDYISPTDTMASSLSPMLPNFDFDNSNFGAASSSEGLSDFGSLRETLQKWGSA